MRITTWNVNGLRAALRKRFDHHVRGLRPKVLMLQEVRALPEQLEPKRARPRGWKVAWHPAERKGYSGVATWSRQPLEVLGTGMDGPDPEGRVLRVRTQGVQVVNVYLPSGSHSPERQAKKEVWLEHFMPWAAKLAALDEPVVLGGDLNIAHTANDIWNPGGNKKTSGFLPHEREWFGAFLDTGWTDLVRRAHGDTKGPYSWWSNRGRARALDRGWRIDYLLGNAAAAELVVGTNVRRAGGMDTSDHAPVSVDLDLSRR